MVEVEIVNVVFMNKRKNYWKLSHILSMHMLNVHISTLGYVSGGSFSLTRIDTRADKYGLPTGPSYTEGRTINCNRQAPYFQAC